MSVFSLRTAALALAAAGLSGCGYNGLYSGVSVGTGYGYNSAYGYGPYGAYDPYYGYAGSRYGYNPYGYGYSPYGGWYNGYYYPGSGYYVYDRDHRRREMTPQERLYWRQRVASVLADKIRDNRGTTSATQTTRVETRSPVTTREAVRSQSRATTSSSQARRESIRSRVETRRAAREERRSDRRSRDDD